jgi:hypothetical protein
MKRSRHRESAVYGYLTAPPGLFFLPLGSFLVIVLVHLREPR